MEGKRKSACRKFGIDKAVLAGLGELSSTRGGSDARKAEGRSNPLNQEKFQFMERGIPDLILRVAADPENGGPRISLAKYFADDTISVNGA